MQTLPILLIHGFNGAPTNWTGPEDRFPEYLAEHGLDPDLIRVFHYGYDEYHGNQTYNALGDMREIAHRLDMADSHDPDVMQSSVERLSRESVAKGGPDKITIIAHSSGGLIARYYLSRKTPDAFGTQYRGHVGRLICLGTPHQGVDIEDLLDPLPTNLLIYRLMVRLHFMFPPEYHEHANALRDEFEELRTSTLTEFRGRADTETPAFKQFHPHSEFLNDINRPGAMPRDVAFFDIAGEVRARMTVQAFGKTLVHGERGLGDMLVSRESATTIPNAPSDNFVIMNVHGLDVDVQKHLSHVIDVENQGEAPVPLHRWLRSHPASRRRMMEILGIK